MSALPIREAVIASLQELSDEEVAEVLEFMQEVKAKHTSPEYDENDPLVGFISGPTDLAERSEEILRAEFGLNKSDQSDER